MKKPKILTFVILMIIGIVLTLISTFIYSDSHKYDKGGVTADAKIMRIESTYDSLDEEYDYYVHVEFDYNGRTFVGLLDSYDTNMREGGSVKVIFLPENPNAFIAAPSAGTDAVAFILGVVGGIMTLVGLVFIIGFVYVLIKSRH